MAYLIPPAAGVDWKSWDFIKQFYYAVRERYAAAGFLTWPRAAWVYDFGVITAITSTSVTIGGKTWATSPDRWVGYDNTTGGGWEASDYDLIIDDCDPRKVIRSRITAQPSGDTLTIDDITQRVTERVTPSIASLVGRTGRIIKRGGIWWCDRWIEWPNDQIYADGLVESSAAGTLTSTRGLSSHVLTAREILFFNGTPTLQRGTVTGRSGRTLTFTGTSGAAGVGTYFAIVDVDGYCQLDRVGGRPKSFYRGKADAYYSHWPDDTLTATPKPAVTVDFKFGKIPGSCPAFATAYPILDREFWIEQDEVCDFVADATLSPDLYKTVRGLMDAVIDICDRYVDRFVSFDHALSIPNLTVATWLNSAGINSQGATAGTHSGTGLPVSLSGLPYVPHEVWFAVLADDGTPQTFGKGTYDGTEIIGSFSAADDGQPVIVSAGFTRWVPRQFRRWRDVTGFIPGDDGGAVWPPTESFPGDYQTLPASTHYLECDAIGNMVEATRAEDAFADGDLARFVGDNFDDPTTNDAVGDGLDSLTPYRDRRFTGRRTRAIQSRIDASRFGRASEGSTSQLTATVDWWGVDFWTPGAVFVRTAAATGGSTTTLIDTAQAGSAFWDDAARNQTGMVVTVTRPSDATLHKRLITAHAGTTITFSPALPFAVAAGTVYAIRETDGVVNRWKGRSVKLSKIDPATGLPLTATATIDGNDDATIFFPAIAWAADETTTFRIEDEPVGGVWLRAGGAWTVPTGTDPRGVNPEFQVNQTANAETMVKRLGLPGLRDFVVLANFTELKNAISALKKTKLGSPAWTSRADDATPELNRNTGFSSGTVGSWATFEGQAVDKWDSHDDLIEASGPPFAFAELNVGDPRALIRRQYAYMKTTLVPGLCAPGISAVSWYVYGEIDADFDDAGGTDPVFTFDDNGDPVYYRQWSDTGLSTTIALPDLISDKFGTLGTIPNWPTTPGEPPYDEVSGYYVANQAAIVDWAMVYI